MMSDKTGNDKTGNDRDAKPDARPESRPEREKVFENTPTSLDESTHRELQLLYREATDTIRFAKHMQWWTVGSTLVLFFAFIGIAKFVGADMTYAKIITMVVIFISMSCISALIMYQFWQFNEQQKITEIGRHFSTLFKRIRRIKSTRESNVHRYTLLLFMIAVVVIGASVTYLGVIQVAEHNRPTGYQSR
jgi:hypothetical protein